MNRNSRNSVLLAGYMCMAVLALPAGEAYGQNEACCLGGGTCADLTPVLCTSAGGISLGVGTTCAGLSTEGACCEGVQCSISSPECCAATGGTFQGSGTICGFVACCMPDNTCVTSSGSLCCLALGGDPQPGFCIADEGCCFPDGTCTDLDPACCTAIGGTPCGPGNLCQGDNNGNGIDDACEVHIPAISNYGLIALTLLILTAGTIVIRRRRRIAAA